MNNNKNLEEFDVLKMSYQYFNPIKNTDLFYKIYYTTETNKRFSVNITLQQYKDIENNTLRNLTKQILYSFLVDMKIIKDNINKNEKQIVKKTNLLTLEKDCIKIKFNNEETGFIYFNPNEILILNNGQQKLAKNITEKDIVTDWN
jgi:hypothetical protein